MFLATWPRRAGHDIFSHVEGSPKHILPTRLQPLLKSYVHSLQELFQERLISVVLYGSVPRGSATPESDIDILIALRDSERAEDWKARHRAHEALMEHYPDAWKIRAILLSLPEARKNRYLYLDMTEDALLLFDSGGFFQGKLDDMRRRLGELGSRRVWLRDGSWYWDLKPDLRFGEQFEL